VGALGKTGFDELCFNQRLPSFLHHLTDRLSALRALSSGTLFGHAGGLALSIIKRSDAAKGFVLLPRRWVVERTFGWLVKARRLVRDHERNPRHHEALVYIAMIGHSARHLTAKPTILQPL
jgi:transposase